MRDPGERVDLLEEVLLGLPEGFVLRGSLLASQWIPDFPREPRDLDLVGLGAWDVQRTADRLFAGLDAARFPRRRAVGIWEHTDFPGVRLQLRGRGETGLHGITVDIGFGDPLVPAPVRHLYRPQHGEPFPVLAVHPATAIAWKLHGVAERPPTQWRPKDLLDLDLLLEHCSVEDDALVAAVRPAFESRGDPFAHALDVLRDGRMQLPEMEVRWSASFGPSAPSLFEVAERVQNRLIPILSGEAHG